MKRLLLIAPLLVFGAVLTTRAQTILLDNFNGGGTTGILSGTSWVGAGNVILNGTTITVGNTAKNDNGWGFNGTAINATGMNYITIVAQLGGTNAAPFLVIGFEDSALNSQVFSVPMSSFTTGASTTVQIPITSWGTVDFTGLTGWTIGGGTAGVVLFGMTFDNLALSATAIPEPGTAAALAGLAALGWAIWRRRAARV